MLKQCREDLEGLLLEANLLPLLAQLSRLKIDLKKSEAENGAWLIHCGYSAKPHHSIILDGLTKSPSRVTWVYM
jgi:hypothetical protein